MPYAFPAHGDASASTRPGAPSPPEGTRANLWDHGGQEGDHDRATRPMSLRYIAPLVETLRELGDSGTSAEVSDRVVEQLGIPTDRAWPCSEAGFRPVEMS